MHLPCSRDFETTNLRIVLPPRNRIRRRTRVTTLQGSRPGIRAGEGRRKSPRQPHEKPAGTAASQAGAAASNNTIVEPDRMVKQEYQPRGQDLVSAAGVVVSPSGRLAFTVPPPPPGQRRRLDHPSPAAGCLGFLGFLPSPLPGFAAGLPVEDRFAPPAAAGAAGASWPSQKSSSAPRHPVK